MPPQAWRSRHGVEAEVTYHRYYPATVNSAAEAAARAARPPTAAACRRSVAPRPAFTSEDFAFLLRERPGAYLWLGQGASIGPSERPLHHPCYDFNDEALPLRRALVLRGRRAALPRSALHALELARA